MGARPITSSILRGGGSGAFDGLAGFVCETFTRGRCGPLKLVFFREFAGGQRVEEHDTSDIKVETELARHQLKEEGVNIESRNSSDWFG